MGDFQYKSASANSYADVVKVAYYGTLAGEIRVVYPEPQDRDGEGHLCGAVGLPYIRLQSEVMSAAGVSWWQANFLNTTDLTVEFWLTAYNDRSGTWLGYTGWLNRPTYDRVQIGSSNNSTLYYNVNITMDRIASAPVPT